MTFYKYGILVKFLDSIIVSCNASSSRILIYIFKIIYKNLANIICEHCYYCEGYIEMHLKSINETPLI